MGSRTIHLHVTDASNYNPSFISCVNLAKSSSMSDPVFAATVTNAEDVGVECSVSSSCCYLSVQGGKCVLKHDARMARWIRPISTSALEQYGPRRRVALKQKNQSRGINTLRRYPSLKLLKMMPLHAKLHQACGPGLRAACFNTVSTSRYTALVAS